MLWLRDCLAEELELKTVISGFGSDEIQKAKFLGGEIRLHVYGVSYKGDSKHTVILLDEGGMNCCKVVVSPGCEH